MPTLGAARAGEAVGEDAAFEVAAKFPLNVCWCRMARCILRQFEPGDQVSLHGTVEHAAFGLATTIGGSTRSGTRDDGGVHGHPDRWIGIGDYINTQLFAQIVA